MGIAPRTLNLVSLCFGLAFVVVLWFTVDGLVPPSAVVAGLTLGAVAVGVRRVSPERVAVGLVGGAALALGLLAVAVWFRPLAGVPLPDIGVLGPYTYLATEVAFGTVAAGLLWRAGRDAVRRAGVTIAVLYPIAYVWDWYTLAVGVFAIPLRTGVEFVGIPLEEHIFMVVVPALVLAIHETLHGRDECEARTE